MSKSGKIIWIDDTSTRKLTADEIRAEFIDAHEKDLADEIDRLFKSTQPSLIVLDHILDTTSNTNPVFKRGSTLAEVMKEKWPDCPVIGVTNVDIALRIDLRTQRTYDALFPFENISAHFEEIDSIRSGFARISSKKPTTSFDIVNFLRPPQNDIERLKSVLPEDLKNSFSDASITSRIYEWVKKIFDRPGFLYDSLWAATFLGLNEVGFSKVVNEFHLAEYKGVFSQEANSRWWSNMLSEILYKTKAPDSGEMSWETGRKLPRIMKKHYSICYVCKEPFPETVAYLDELSSDRYPMHLRCTILHPGYKRELYFEDIRMMNVE
jgi:hypothetical protein